MKRMSPKERKSQILKAALQCAEATHYKNFTRVDVSKRISVSEGLVNVYFKTMPKLRRAVMRAAVKNKCLVVLAQGLIDGNPYALKASKELKKLSLDKICTNVYP